MDLWCLSSKNGMRDMHHIHMKTYEYGHTRAIKLHTHTYTHTHTHTHKHILLASMSEKSHHDVSLSGMDTTHARTQMRGYTCTYTLLTRRNPTKTFHCLACTKPCLVYCVLNKAAANLQMTPGSTGPRVPPKNKEQMSRFVGPPWRGLAIRRPWAQLRPCSVCIVVVCIYVCVREES